MATVRCDNGHYFDDRKYTNCPHCPAIGLRDVNIQGTRAASRTSPNATEAAAYGQPDASKAARPGVGRTSTPGVTVAAIFKRTGVDPVVGWLVCTKGPNKGRDFRLHSDLNKIGRSPSMDVCIEGDETISRENHCQVAYSPRTNTFNIMLGEGRNLIYKNDEAVFSAMPLSAYDRIDMGESSFVFIPFCSDRFNWDSKPEQEAQSQQRRPPGVEEPPVV
jgi:hypothetical protein